MAFNIALDSKQFIHCRKSDLIGGAGPQQGEGSLERSELWPSVLRLARWPPYQPFLFGDALNLKTYMTPLSALLRQIKSDQAW